MLHGETYQKSQKIRTGILYFSGAGNTECLALIFQGVFARRGDCKVVFFERITRKLNLEALPEFDILGIGFPIYFRRTPSIVFETIDRLKGKGQSVFTFCTKGMYSGNVTRDILSRCASTGLVPVGHFEAFMPGTDILLLFARKGSLTERIVKKMHSRHLDRKANQFAEAVLQTEGPSIPRVKWYTPIENKVVKPLERLVTRDYQVFKEGYYVLPGRCTCCLLCVQNCPEDNISLQDGRIVFGNHCDHCLRCIHHCPTEAIQIGIKTLKTVRYWPKATEGLKILIEGNNSE